MKQLLMCLISTMILINIVSSGVASPFAHINDTKSNESTYVIITTRELARSVSLLQLWKQFLGFSTEIVTIPWISNNYEGVDVQEKIRNFLIDKYEDWQISYVLFVGSREIIPMREVFTIPEEFEEGYGSLFTDFYYADLTGDWDADGDGLYGEYLHDSIDFTADVHVGRIPCDTTDLVRAACQRSISFESDKGSWKQNILQLASIIYYENLESFNHVYERSDGATLMEECRTDLFEPEGYHCTRMYEEEGISPSTYEYDYPLNSANVISEWVNGYAMVTMLGHANERSITRFIWDHDDGDNIPEIGEGELYYYDFLRRSDGDRIALEKPPIVFSSGCSQLHTSNNMGRSFIEDGAATAFIGSTDLGLYNITKVWRDEHDGGCFSILYYFMKYFIVENQKCGEALSNAKSYFYEHFWFHNETYYEWIWRCYSTMLGYTLYGDPALNIIYERESENTDHSMSSTTELIPSSPKRQFKVHYWSLLEMIQNIKSYLVNPLHNKQFHLLQ